MPIQLDHVSHVYMAGTPMASIALEQVDLSLEEGQFIGIIGHTGSGKSTLIQHLNGLLRPSSGVVRVGEYTIGPKKEGSLKELRRKVGLVFQYPEYQLFEETIALDVAFGPKNLGLSKEEIRERAQEALTAVGMDYEKYKDVSPFELSGGQKRRVAIAGVLAMRPDVLILDEPTAGLDPRGHEEILSMVQSLHRKGENTVVMVSHSMEDVAKLSDTVLVMSGARVVMVGTPVEVFSRDEELIRLGLDVPQTVKLLGRLRKAGWNLPQGIFDLEETVAAIAREWEARHA